ncbi:MAG: redoxin domain-containing protein, partial [Woeseiaceae bacterium]|nr:redoxin domain-containing protein [Woeseiaceae bacterium]
IIIGTLLALVAIALAIGWWFFRIGNGRPVPECLRRGKPLPDFLAHDEQGNPVRSTSLHGTAAVLLFVRGSWCPFCSSQVENLTRYYKDIVDLGARLILVTPKPLETTRRVAEFFEVEFDFWLDDSLDIARQLELVHAAGVPDDYRKEYGTDTVWPTAVVVNPAGIISYTRLSKTMADRPDAAELLAAIEAAVDD